MKQVPRGNPGEEERSQPVHRCAAARAGLEQLGALTGIILVWWRQHLLLSHRDIKGLHRLSSYLCTSVSRLPPCLVLVVSVCGSPLCWRSNTAGQVARRTVTQPFPLPIDQLLSTSDFQQKCATAWNFSCGWHKTHKQVSMPPGFISSLCHPYSSCKPVSLRPMLKNRGLRGTDWMHDWGLCGFLESIEVSFVPIWKQIKDIQHLHFSWGWGSWNGWALRSCKCLPWSTATQKVFVYRDKNGEQITKDKMDNNRYRRLVIEEYDMLAQWHLQWHIPSFSAFICLSGQMS